MKKRLFALTTTRGALVYAGGQVLAFFTKADARASWKRFQIPGVVVREVEIRSVLRKAQEGSK